MKFAKELEDELVPEWRAKYLDYKQGKKKVKAVGRALRNVHKTPNLGGFWRDDPESPPAAARLPFTHYDFPISRPDLPPSDAAPSTTEDASPQEQTSKPNPLRRASTTVLMHTPPLAFAETQPLKNAGADHGHTPKNYGSILGTPNRQTTSPDQSLSPLKLPDPALAAGTDRQKDSKLGDLRSKKQKKGKDTPDAYHVGSTQTPSRKASGLPRHLFGSRRTASTGQVANAARSPFLTRMISGTGIKTPQSSDVPLGAYRELDNKQDEFFQFLDKELDKIESFYREKEDEASSRLQVLRAQLHEMRDRRLEEILAAQKHGDTDKNVSQDSHMLPNGNSHDHAHGIFKPLENIVARTSRVGKTSEYMAQLGSPSKSPTEDPDARRDYVVRFDHNQRVSYRLAKRKLKLALQEFYRGLELLKSYSLVNRTAFRKINKKYDKAVNARPTGRYVSEKITGAHFVKSDVIDSYIVAVEDLYARYFERGNHKVAVGKLRSRLSKSPDCSQTSFRNGVWLAAGAALGIQGMVYGFQHLNYHGNPAVRLQTSYLLQLYGGYFLGVLIFLLFVLDCRVWARSKINYIFVFEFDSRHVLDWQELAELPSFFLFLEGLFIWLNFRQGGEDAMFLYWPVILVGLTLIIMCIPLRVLYHRSRMWWGYSNWRLLLAGLYPVEFRDFFLGDMFCSLTYSMGNIQLFFCLYARKWSNPPICNSTHSRLLGFFATLPAIWRAFQCIRRYYDSRNWFPHLANCGKYTFSILYYMSLSMYRINATTSMHALFILFATINATYCSVWDIAMDWSLGNPWASHPYLRDNLGYRRIWVYYAAMILDPPLRFTWLFYAIFGHETPHSTLVSFIIALAEVARRGMWAVFRVENEHCANVGRFRASRDVPLPYSLPSSPKQSQALQRPATAPPASAVDLEEGDSTGPGSLRHRRTWTAEDATPMTRSLRRVGTIMNEAHTQDFERRNRPGVVGGNPEHASANRNDESSDEDDDSDDRKDDEADMQDMQQAQTMLDRAHA